MKKFKILVLSTVLAMSAFGQRIEDVDEIDANPRAERPLGVKMLIGGFDFIPAVGVEYYVFPSLKFEADFGFLSSLFMTGFQYHFLGNRDKLGTFTLGAHYLALEDREMINDGWYFPVGFQYMGLNGWLVAVEIGPLTHKDISAEPWFLGITVGHHFNGLKWRK